MQTATHQGKKITYCLSIMHFSRELQSLIRCDSVEIVEIERQGTISGLGLKVSKCNPSPR